MIDFFRCARTLTLLNRQNRPRPSDRLRCLFRWLKAYPANLD